MATAATTTRATSCHTLRVRSRRGPSRCRRPPTPLRPTNPKAYARSASAAAIPTITSGTLAGADTAVLTETYDNKNVGTGKTLTPTATIRDANGGKNYVVTLVPTTTGALTPLATTVNA